MGVTAALELAGAALGEVDVEPPPLLLPQAASASADTAAATTRVRLRVRICLLNFRRFRRGDRSWRPDPVVRFVPRGAPHAEYVVSENLC